jgi:murein DD-endopeptidase MepM/ murein hydrolase activator NlpD
MSRPAVKVGAAVALSVAVLVGTTGVAVAAGGTTLPGAGLPSTGVTLPPLPTPVPTLPSTVPTLPPGGSNPFPGGSAGGATQGPAHGPASGHGASRSKAGSTVTPAVAGSPADALDDESSPALNRASRAYLAADTSIAALTKSRDAIEAARVSAAQLALSNGSLQIAESGARSRVLSLQERSARLQRMVTADAVQSYQEGRAATDETSARNLASADVEAKKAVTRAETQLASIVAAQDRGQADLDRYTTLDAVDQQQLSSIDVQLAELARQRAAALARAQRAKAGDLARNRQTIAESGLLGAEIRAASAHLEATGRTVQGTGQFIRPGSGVITSPYGMRMHPILHYVKLHTGTDFAVGNGFSHAADDGRVLFTIVSVAYGNFTVIDHGIIDGRHITTAYAHQAKFLVKPGDIVKKGQVIGVIGSTGYATGPHLHFEVRDNGAVENPMGWLPN